mgnify:CR=1 FL=1
MARVKIELPERYIFSTEITLRITDMNYGNHLANDKVLSLVHEARVQFFRNLGISEMDIGDGISIIQSDAAIQYKSEGFYGDVIRVEIAVGEFSRVGFDILYHLTKVADGATLAIAKTGIVCFDYKQKKMVGVPESFKAKV